MSNEYRDTLLDKAMLNHPLKKIISIRHKPYTKECMKKTFSFLDEKRYLISDGINTYALGHINTFKK